METLQSNIAADLEQFDVDEVVELFTLDATAIGGEVYRFTSKPVEGSNPVFDGQTYVALPFESSGWEWSGDGPLPEPTLRFALALEEDDLATLSAVLLSIVYATDDLLGAKVTRVLTLRKYLDDGADPDPQANLGAEVFYVEQKSEQTRDGITFKLRASLDVEGVVLPRRQCLNRCAHIYRIADGQGGFDYTLATCPYVGAAMFDLEGAAVTDPAEDRCGKLLKHCKARFGASATLPFQGFPGVGRISLT